MTQFVGDVFNHSLAFIGQCFGSRVEDKVKDVENFLWTAQRVVFAAGFFFLMQGVQPQLSSMTLSFICSAVFVLFPEICFGLGCSLFYRAVPQFLAVATYAKPEVLIVHGTINVISGLVAFTWFEKNYQKDHFFNDAFKEIAKYCAPWVAGAI